MKFGNKCPSRPLFSPSNTHRSYTVWLPTTNAQLWLCEVCYFFFLERVPRTLIQTAMITYFANVDFELGIHENRLDVHRTLLEIKSWKHQIGDWGQYFYSPHISEHQGCVLGADVLACKLRGKRFQESGHSKSFLRMPILSYVSGLKKADQTNRKKIIGTLYGNTCSPALFIPWYE